MVPVGTTAMDWWCQQYQFVSAAALQPGTQYSGAGLALSAQPLARQLGISQPGRHHGGLRDGMEPVRRRSRLDPLLREPWILDVDTTVKPLSTVGSFEDSTPVRAGSMSLRRTRSPVAVPYTE